MVESLSAGQARRILLAAQGFGRPTPAVGTRQLNSTVERLGLLQLDSVNVFERSHYLPLFARLGSYDKALLDRLTFRGRSRYVEYWAHEAALIPIASWPLWRWKMDALSARDHLESDWVQSNGAMLDWLRSELADRGPIAASEIEHDANVRQGPWWGWSDVKRGLEFLFRWGEVVSAGRTRFERRYGLAERMLPEPVLITTVSRSDAHLALVGQAARALGVATAADLADYYRLRRDEAMPAIEGLVERGEILPVTVHGWGRPAWLHRDARVPRRIHATALLSPFDPVVWDRARAERMFGFRYRIEIYTPEPKRTYGYYSLPLLIDDALVGRIDLKSDRQNRVLRVQSAWREPGASMDLDRVVNLLDRTREWQQLDSIAFAGVGNLSAELARHSSA